MAKTARKKSAAKAKKTSKKKAKARNKPKNKSKNKPMTKKKKKTRKARRRTVGDRLASAYRTVVDTVKGTDRLRNKLEPPATSETA